MSLLAVDNVKPHQCIHSLSVFDVFTFPKFNSYVNTVLSGCLTRSPGAGIGDCALTVQ